MNKTKIKVGILSTTSLSMSALAISSALNSIIKAFPNDSIAKIQMIATIPNLSALISTLVVGTLATHFSKKSLTLVGTLVLALGGLMPLVFHNSVNELLICALLLGIGIGFINTLAPMLISLFFADEERASVMGQSTAINSFGSIILMMGGSFLGAKNWVNTYLIFLLTIPVILLVIFFLPQDSTQKAAATKSDTSQDHHTWQIVKSLSGYVFALATLTFLLALIYNIFPTNLSIIINTKHLGGTSLTGIINSLGTLGGVLTGFSMKYLNKLFKNQTLTAGFVALALTFFFIYFFKNIVLIIIGALLSGFAMSMIMSTVPFLISLVSKPAQVAMAMAIFQFANSLGGTIAPLVLKLIHINAGVDSFLFGGICSIVVAVICLVSQIGRKAMNFPNRNANVEAD